MKISVYTNVPMRDNLSASSKTYDLRLIYFKQYSLRLSLRNLNSPLEFFMTQKVQIILKDWGVEASGKDSVQLGGLGAGAGGEAE